MKNTKYKVNSWVITAVVVIAVILVNLIASAVDTKFPLKIDMTKDKIYEMTDETKTAMKELNTPVNAYVLCTESEAPTLIKEYINRYKSLTDKVKFEYIDIYKNQTMLMKYQQSGESVTAGDIILECGERHKIISVSGVKNEVTTMGSEKLYSFDLESKLTNGITYVAGLVSEDKIYFLKGHGETQSKGFESAISDLNHVSETISIASADSQIPDDASMVVAFMPNADFSEEECQKIDSYLDKGGKFVAVYNPGLVSCPRFEAYLTEWGITPVHNLVCENDTTKMVKSPVIFRPELKDHDITKNLINMDLQVLYYGSISFDTNSDNQQKATVTSLAQTSDKAVGKANINATSAEYEEGDTRGSFDVCVLSEKDVTVNGETKKASVMAIGSMAVTDYTDERANVEFVKNTINYMTENTSNVSITSKIITEGLFTQPSVLVQDILYYLLVWIIPIGLLIAGIVIWLRRRYL